MNQPLTAAVRYLSGEREPARVATTANITLQGLQTIDDVELEVGDRVLVKDQTDQKQNGIYLASEGRWFRAPDASYTRAINEGVTVAVQEGTAGNGKTYRFTSTNPSVGTDPITLILFHSESLAAEMAAEIVAQITPIKDEALAGAAEAELWAGVAQASVPNAFPLTRTTLKALNTASVTAAYLLEKGREGMFLWDGSDLSSKMTVRSVTTRGVYDASDEFSTKAVSTTSVDATTDVITATAHGFTEGEQVTVTTSVNGLIAGGRYYAYNVTANTLQLRTSLTAGAFNLTGTTNFVLHAFHDLVTGAPVVVSASVNGLTTNTIYYAIRTSERIFKLASSFANAHAGVAVNITGTTDLTITEIADPLEGWFVVKTGASLTGSAGAWVRQALVVDSRHFGAKGDGVTDDGHALQASLWFGLHSGRVVHTPAAGRSAGGAQLAYLSSTPIVHKTRDWLYGYSPIQAPDNGVMWLGDGREKTLIRCSAAFPDSGYLLTLDGNRTVVPQIVGSRPMAQGTNVIRGIGFYGRGTTTGTDVRGVFVRGCWGMEWDNLDFREFSGDMITVGSGAPAGPPNYDEVDNTANWVINRCRFLGGGKSAFIGNVVRIANLTIEKTEFRGFGNWGINACLSVSAIHECVFEGCGNRADATTGAIRLQDSVSGSLSRTVDITKSTFENNFNNDIDMVACRGGRIEGNSFHTFLQAGGVIANKASVKLRIGATGSTHDIIIAANRWPDYSAPPDGAKYDAPNISIASGVAGVTLQNNVTDTANTHVTVASPNRLHIINIPTTYVVTLTGAAPVQSYKNYTAL